MGNYFILWTATRNGRTGRGRAIFTKERAEQLTRELNAEYPEVIHQVLMEPEIVEAKNRQKDKNHNAEYPTGVRPRGVRHKGSNRAQDQQHPKHNL